MYVSSTVRGIVDVSAKYSIQARLSSVPLCHFGARLPAALSPRPTLIIKRSVNTFTPTITDSLRRSFHTDNIRAMASNGNKRKKNEALVSDRPAKQMKPETPSFMNGVETPGSEPIYTESEPDETRILPPVPATADTAEWQATIERVVRNVVSINFCQTCSFDTETSGHGEATGFVVDVEKGYILTNRHVASPVRSLTEILESASFHTKSRGPSGDTVYSTITKRYTMSWDFMEAQFAD